MNPFLVIGGMVGILLCFLVAGTIDYHAVKELPVYSQPCGNAE